MSEKARLNDILADVSALPETMVWRNNTGQAWQGDKVDLRGRKYVQVEPGMVVLRKARPITFGLPGSGDIMGASGRRPLAVEVKDDGGRQSQQQILFERAWTRIGGIYVLARDSREAVEGIERALLLG